MKLLFKRNAKENINQNLSLYEKQQAQRQYLLDTLKNFNIRPLQLAQIFPGIENVTLPISAVDPDTSHLNHVDMLYVTAISHQIKAKRIFEFGTYLGRTTYHLATSLDAENIFTLDLDPTVDHPKEFGLGRAVQSVHRLGLQGHFFKNHACGSKVTQLHGDCRTFDYAPYRNNIDFIFIDGGHSYDIVKNDTQHAIKMLKKGGVIVWHDFAPKSPDVIRFARELSVSKSLFWIKDTSLLVYIDGIDAMQYQAPTPPYARSILKPVEA